jgi:hypothetical protein
MNYLTTSYLYIGLFILLFSGAGILRILLQKRNRIPYQLFNEALRQENNGDIQKAIIKYETALNETLKMRYKEPLRARITAKLKLLHSVIDYEKMTIIERIV